MKRWTIIYITGNDVIKVVPSNWLYQKKCYWPPYAGKKLMQAISSCETPIFNKWHKLEIEQLANGHKYYDLSKAIADVETKKVTKPKRIYIGHISDIDDINQFESDSILQHNISSRTASKKRKLNNQTESSSDSEHDVPNATLPFSSSKIIPRKHDRIESYQLPSTSTCNKSQILKPSDISDDDFKKQVLLELKTINLRQRLIFESISDLFKKAEKNEPFKLNNNFIFKNFNLPLKELQELEKLEEFLSQKNNFKKFIKEIMQIEGPSYKDTVKHVLTRIMSNNLSKTYSWIGSKKKRNFSSLRICSAILAATQNTHGCSKAMIASMIKDWLEKSTN